MLSHEEKSENMSLELSSLSEKFDVGSTMEWVEMHAFLDEAGRKVLNFCLSPKSNTAIQEECLGLTKHTKNFNKYIKPLLELGYLDRTIPLIINETIVDYIYDEEKQIVKLR